MRNKMKLIDSLRKAFEEQQDTNITESKQDENTKPHREDELVFYCKITDMDGLKQADSKEHHEQWEIKNSRGRVRVRATSKDGLEPKYELTFKTKSENAGIVGSIEQNNPINKEIFDGFHMLSTRGMIKDRYCFPVKKLQIKNSAGLQDIVIEGVFYEVDVFFNEDNTYNEYVKIDLELNTILDKLKESHPDLGEFKLNVSLMELPFKPTEIIIGREPSAEDKEKIDKLYDEVFISKNILKKSDKEDAQTSDENSNETDNTESSNVNKNTEEKEPVVENQ